MLLSGRPAAPAGSSDARAVRLEPRHGLAQAFLEPDARLPAELAQGTRGVEHATRLAVGLRHVPDDVALEAAGPGHQRHEVADEDLEARAQVHRVALLVALGGGDDALGGV